MEVPVTQWQVDEEEIFQGPGIEEGMGMNDYNSQGEAPLPAVEKEVPTPNERLQKLLQEVGDYSLEKPTDASLASLTWRDFPALRRVRAKLSVLSKDKKIDIFLCGHLNAMIGALNLYLDPTLSYGWRESSVLAANASGHGVYHARCIRQWIHRFLMFGKLPLHQYGYSKSVLEDEDFSQTIQLHLQERAKDGYIRAEDIVDFLSSPEMQEQFPEKKIKITIRTAQRWLHNLEWRYGKKHNGMYVDGHEREDVVAYRVKFLQRMKEYMRRMVTYDNDGNPIEPQGFPVEGGPFRIILVTHDESTFYANDRRKTAWVHLSDKAVPQPKGEGQSLMISDFPTLEWGRLVDSDE